MTRGKTFCELCDWGVRLRVIFVGVERLSVEWPITAVGSLNVTDLRTSGFSTCQEVYEYLRTEIEWEGGIIEASV